jgi:hypothetical protein
MPSIRGLSLSTSGSRSRQASFSAARTIHQDTAKPEAVSDTALPDDDRIHQLVPEPASRAGEARGLWRGFEERHPVAGWFFAVPAVLGPEHIHGPGDRNIAKPLEAPLLAPGSNDAAARAARWLVRFDDDLPSASSDGGGNDAVIGQVEEDGGSVGCDPGRLVVLFQVECLANQRLRRAVRTENARGCCFGFWFQRRSERMMGLSVVVEADVSMVPSLARCLAWLGGPSREPWTVA